MKGKLIKELHAIGVYRDPKTKRKLESMKTVEVFQLKAGVLNGDITPIPKDTTPVVFITPPRKGEKLATGSRKKAKK